MKPRLFLPAILSGVLLWTAFFPLDLGPVAYIALVPFLTLVRAEGVGRVRRYLAALVGGLTFAVLAFQWVRVAHPMMAMFAWPGSSLYLACYWPLALFLLRRLDRADGLPGMTEAERDGGQRRPPFTITLPIVWVALEYFRAHAPTGFPFLQYVGLYQLAGMSWYTIGYTQHHVLPLIQSADLGGVYLVSVLVTAANGAVYEWACRMQPFRWLMRMPRGWVPPTYTREFTLTAGVIGLAAVLLCYGGLMLVHPPFEVGPAVAILQGNLAQDEKSMAPDPKGGPHPLEKEYFPLAKGAAGNGQTRRPDLIIWPETCFPDNWYEVGPAATAGNDPDEFQQQQRFAEISQRNFNLFTSQVWKTNSLYGLNALVWDTDKPKKYNSALFVRSTGQIAGRYDKMHLVPFGEYVPFKNKFPWLQSLTPYTHDYSCTPGENYTLFDLRATNGQAYRFGVLICYEDSDPYLARQYNPMARRGPGADFLVNISNDGWFDGTEEHEEHLAICRFRAVEARRSVVRAVNMGISGVIDPDGRVIALPRETWAESKKVSAVVRELVPIDHRDSIYAATGDWVPALCWLLIGLAIAVPRVMRRTRG